MKYTFLILLFMTTNVVASNNDFAFYMSRTKNNDYSYEKESQEIIFNDKDFQDNCWSKIASLSVEVFYTIDTNGKVSDITTFRKDVDISCLKLRMENINFPKPAKTFYGWWLIWDGAGG